ncbi:MAG: serine/threonine protein kinase [Deltaproteobacteria bacterium]|nr:serine/threonine protein kinase [Deltaproteobacteria bacterium]
MTSEDPESANPSEPLAAEVDPESTMIGMTSSALTRAEDPLDGTCEAEQTLLGFEFDPPPGAEPQVGPGVEVASVVEPAPVVEPPGVEGQGGAERAVEGVRVAGAESPGGAPAPSGLAEGAESEAGEPLGREKVEPSVGDSSAPNSQTPVPRLSRPPLTGQQIRELAREVDPSTLIADRYRIEEKIAEGGMGIVYRATHIQLDRPVALKTLKPRLLHDTALEQRFYLEAAALARIRHGNTVTIHDYGSTSEGLLYIVMEFLQGVTLAKLLAEEGPLPFVRILPIMLQVARALRSAHNEGILHRDLKPANIIVTRDEEGRDEVKVVDFGLASFLNASLEEPKAGQAVMGTPAYMSPEQVLGADIDHRTDIYSFGVIFFALSAGVAPFVGKKAAEVARQHLDVEAPMVSSVGYQREVPESIEKIIAKCLAKSRDHRFESTAELIEAIKVAHAELGRAAVESTGPVVLAEAGLAEMLSPATEQPLERPHARSSFPGWAVWAALAVGGAVLLLATERRPDAEPVAPVVVQAGPTPSEPRPQLAPPLPPVVPPGTSTQASSVPSAVDAGAVDAGAPDAGAKVSRPKAPIPAPPKPKTYSVPILE